MCAATYQEYANAGMVALHSFYDPSTGLWKTTGWWNAANALETTIDYSAFTNAATYRATILNTFEKNRHKNFLNDFYDDQGWWALAWLKAYDLTRDSRYLEMAKTIFQDMTGGWDKVCGGGIWWSKERKYKNAIANELFLAIAARLYLRTRHQPYLDWAQRTWTWFRNTGLINRQNLINDGLNAVCQNNGEVTWTYNQGVILGGLVDLYKGTRDQSLLNQAQAIADAATLILAPNGILQEPCEPNCGKDGPQFKGIFMRNLSYLARTLNQPVYKAFIVQNAEMIWQQNRNEHNQFGLCWKGKFDQTDAARQSAAMDALNAAILASRTACVYPAETAVLHDLGVEAIYGGHRGAGYVAGWNEDGQWIDFQVSVAATGQYNLTLRYAAAGGDASRYIYVNGKSIVSNQKFAKTESWNQWREVLIENVSLTAGINTISVIYDTNRGSQNCLNLDELIVW
jgi:predicted alpha-1,6-mannanase (GH76 family)